MVAPSRRNTLVSIALPVTDIGLYAQLRHARHVGLLVDIWSPEQIPRTKAGIVVPNRAVPGSTFMVSCPLNQPVDSVFWHVQEVVKLCAENRVLRMCKTSRTRLSCTGLNNAAFLEASNPISSSWSPSILHFDCCCSHFFSSFFRLLWLFFGWNHNHCFILFIYIVPVKKNCIRYPCLFF